MSPRAFMRRHWQKRPLLVRQALPSGLAPLQRSDLFALAARDDVESRLVQSEEGAWRLRHGPIPRRSLPPLSRRNWTLLVQGVDLHLRAARELLERFRFLPDARLDDLMVSWASDGGGVGPHLDAYDVFLVQAQGRRRWRIGRAADASFVPDLPLRILKRFEPDEDWLLEPGDLLYLPPGWAHEGTAMGECMTCSVGFRSPSRAELAGDLLARLALEADGRVGAVRYADPTQAATDRPARIPQALAGFARRSVEQLARQRRAVEQALGEALTEPKPRVWFEAGKPLMKGQGLRLDPRSRMLYDDRRVYLNGESFDASGLDARLMRCLADVRRLDPAEVAKLSPAARCLLDEWIDVGWVHGG